jgi:hypothetical protein
MFIFYIHVYGEDSKSTISPKITIYVGCNSEEFLPEIPENLNQQYYVL